MPQMLQEWRCARCGAQGNAVFEGASPMGQIERDHRMDGFGTCVESDIQLIGEPKVCVERRPYRYRLGAAGGDGGSWL